MKKLLIAVFTLTIVLPINAVDFDIYGSVSPGLWFSKTEDFYDDSIGVDSVTNNPIMGEDSLPSYNTTLWPYGALGFNVKGDRFNVCLEIGIRKSMYQGFINDDPAFILLTKEHVSMYAKRFFAEWYINDYLSLLIGKDYAPASFFSSNQRLYGDFRFRNAGCLYTGSRAMFQFSAGNYLSPDDFAEGFSWKVKAAVLKIDTAAVKFRDAKVYIYTETKIPKFEGSYTMHLEKDFLSTNLKVGGGYQRYNMAIHKYKVPADISKEDVDCYVGGFECGAKVGPVALFYDWAWGQNLGAYGIEMGNPLVWRVQDDPMSSIVNIFYPFHEKVVDNPGSTPDEYEMKNGKAVEMCWILNVTPLEWLSLEGGYGYVHAEHELEEYDESWQDTRAYYAGLKFKIADILEIGPEFGQFWYGKERGYGRFTYWGTELAAEF